MKEQSNKNATTGEQTFSVLDTTSAAAGKVKKPVAAVAKAAESPKKPAEASLLEKEEVKVRKAPKKGGAGSISDDSDTEEAKTKTGIELASDDEDARATRKNQRGPAVKQAYYQEKKKVVSTPVDQSLKKVKGHKKNKNKETLKDLEEVNKPEEWEVPANPQSDFNLYYRRKPLFYYYVLEKELERASLTYTFSLRLYLKKDSDVNPTYTREQQQQPSR